jgi:hypothetical protein
MEKGAEGVRAGNRIQLGCLERISGKHPVPHDL